MKKFNLIIAMIVLGSFLPRDVNAQTFDLSTGTNGGGSIGTAGTNDPIWTLRVPGATTFDPVRISTGSTQNGSRIYPNAYVHSDCSQWISPWLNASNNIIPTPGTAGIFTYRMQFTIDSCVEQRNAQLNLSFMAADNLVTAVRVNGVAQTIPGGITHNNSGSMTSTPAVVNGVNTIEVDVRNNEIYTALSLCGYIKVPGDTLSVPRNLNCCEAQGRSLLSWDPVAGATGYQVEITVGDRKCCKMSVGFDIYSSGYYTVKVIDNIYLFNPGSCYSWRVRAVKGSCFSRWSEKKCGCYSNVQEKEEELEPSPRPKVNIKNNTRGTLQVDEVMTAITPNPADNVVTVTIINPTGTIETDVCELKIINLSGVQVLNESIRLDISKEVKLDGLKSGMYICKIVADGRVVSTQKLVIE